MKKIFFAFCLLGFHFALAETPATLPAADTATVAKTNLIENRKDFIFNLGQNGDKPRFTQETQIETKANGEKAWSSEIKDETGTLVMTEKAEIKDDKILHQLVEQLQISEVYELKVEGKKATFLTYKITAGKRGEPTESKTVDISDDFVMGPVTDTFLQNHWKKIIDGKVVYADFGVFELSKAVGFRFKKESSDAKTILIKMQPSNMFISMLVTPIYLTFDKDTKKMVHFKGRTPLREKVDGKWKALDADINYL